MSDWDGNDPIAPIIGKILGNSSPGGLNATWRIGVRLNMVCMVL